MTKTIEILNQLEQEGLINYVIGGSVAALYFTEPFWTQDCDVFVHLESSGLLLSLSPIYNRLLELGYKADGEYIIIDGIPVQFLSIPTPLVQEAFDNHIKVDLGSVKTNIFDIEYLIAICLETGRSKDRSKLDRLTKQTTFDNKKLEEILKRYELWNKWLSWTL